MRRTVTAALAAAAVTLGAGPLAAAPLVPDAGLTKAARDAVGLIEQVAKPRPKAAPAKVAPRKTVRRVAKASPRRYYRPRYAYRTTYGPRVYSYAYYPRPAYYYRPWHYPRYYGWWRPYFFWWPGRYFYRRW